MDGPGCEARRALRALFLPLFLILAPLLGAGACLTRLPWNTGLALGALQWSVWTGGATALAIAGATIEGILVGRQSRVGAWLGTSAGYVLVGVTTGCGNASLHDHTLIGASSFALVGLLALLVLSLAPAYAAASGEGGLRAMGASLHMMRTNWRYPAFLIAGGAIPVIVTVLVSTSLWHSYRVTSDGARVLASAAAGAVAWLPVVVYACAIAVNGAGGSLARVRIENLPGSMRLVSGLLAPALLAVAAEVCLRALLPGDVLVAWSPPLESGPLLVLFARASPAEMAIFASLGIASGWLAMGAVRLRWVGGAAAVLYGVLSLILRLPAAFILAPQHILLCTLGVGVSLLAGLAGAALRRSHGRE